MFTPPPLPPQRRRAPPPGLTVTASSGAGTAAGTSTATAVSVPLGVGASAGVTTVAAVGASLAAGVGSSSGTSTAAAVASTGSIFPLTIDAGGRYLKQNDGAPFLICAQTTWSLFVDIPLADINTFLNTITGQGFNALMGNAIEHHYTTVKPPKERGGTLPFTKRLDGATYTGTPNGCANANGTQGQFAADDYSSIGTQAPDPTFPSNTYWQAVETILNACLAHNVLVMVWPAYLGFHAGDEGWMAEMVAWDAVTGAGGFAGQPWADATKSKMWNYGAWLADRWKAYSHLIWVMGGDYGSGSQTLSTPERNAVNNCMAGMKSVSGQASVLWTAHWNRPCIATDTTLTAGAWDLNLAYCDEEVAETTRLAYAHSPAIPAFLGEYNYEAGSFGGSVPWRKYLYWGFLGGIAGGFFGHEQLWRFDDGTPGTDYTTLLSTQAQLDASRQFAFWKARPWHRLKPSGLGGMGTLITAGGGTASPQSTTYVTAAATSEGDLLLAYVPPDHTGSVTVDMSKLSATAQARWFDPANATFTTIGAFNNTGTHAFTTTGNNSAGDADWLLLLETPAGTSAGVATATAVGASLAAGAGTATGAGSATAAGASIAAGTGTAAGTSTASASSGTVLTGAGTSAGTGTAAGVGAALTAGAGSSAGIGTASAVGASLAASAGAATGIATATATGAAEAAAAGTAAGTGAATATGASLAATAGASTGTSTATAIGAALDAGAGSSTGTATAAATGASLSAAAGITAGVATATAVGQSLAAGVGSAAGIATAAAVGASTSSGQGVGASAGTSTAAAVSTALAASVGSTAGTSTADAIGAALAASAGVATGTGTASGVGAIAGAGSAGASAGASTAGAVGIALVAGTGAAAGSASTIAVGASIAAAVGSAAGGSSASGRSAPSVPKAAPRGTSLLDGTIAKQIATALGAAKILKTATLIKVTAGTRTPGAVSAGTNPTKKSFAAKGIEQNILALQLAGTLIGGVSAAIRLFGATVAGGQIPVAGDQISIGGKTYTIVGDGVSRDPASVSYLCQCKE